jgi:plastocyanin
MLFLFLTVSLAGCRLPAFLTRGTSATSTPTDSVLSGEVSIYLQDNAFHPQQLTVKVGTTVNWINRDPAFHSVTSDTGLFKSSLLTVGQMFSYTFDQPGTYPYYCEKSGGPGGKGMSGKIIVVA